VIFVDTGAWFAVAVRNDPDHEAAMTWLERNREPLMTTDYVMSEKAVEKGSSASLRSIASLQRTAQVRLHSSISRAPRI